ncbi:MAG: hypothetical protein ACI9R3_002162 [Verrucomicrobiales bacterium]|jgi:hypothetical protein
MVSSACFRVGMCPPGGWNNISPEHVSAKGNAGTTAPALDILRQYSANPRSLTLPLRHFLQYKYEYSIPVRSASQRKDRAHGTDKLNFFTETGSELKARDFEYLPIIPKLPDDNGPISRSLVFA